MLCLYCCRLFVGYYYYWDYGVCYASTAVDCLLDIITTGTMEYVMPLLLQTVYWILLLLVGADF